MANPILIDTVGASPVLIGSNTQCGPAHGNGGALYMLMDQIFQIWKSTDNGNSWSFLVGLPANIFSACTFFDYTGFWFFCEEDSNVGNFGTLTSFDATTETFGGTFNVPTDVLDSQLCQCANGNVILVSNAKTDDGRDLVLVTAFNGATFSGPTSLYDISINDPVEASQMTFQVLFTDSNDAMHILAQSDTNEDTTSPRVWHWVVSNTGTIISPTQLAIGPVTTPQNELGLGKGCDANGTLYVFYNDDSGFVKTLVGTGSLLAPAWVDTIIDSTPASDQNFLGKGITAAGKSFLIYGINHLLNEIDVSDGSLGTPVTLYNSDLTPPPPPLSSGVVVEPTSAYIPSLGAIGIGFNEDDGQPHGFFLPFSIAPPVVPVIPPIIGGGGPLPGPWVSPFAGPAEYKSTNAFDHCLCRQRHVWDCMDWTQAACCVPPDYTLLGFGDDLDTEQFDGVAPYQIGAQIGGVRFYKPTAILCPAAISGDVLALTFQIPVGYDAVITGLVLSYTGSGFVEGSGDLIWRVKLNRRWAKDFGQIETSLGTVQTPYPTQILVGSLSTVRVYVNAPNTSGSLNPGVDRVLVQVLGWEYPSGEMGKFQKLRAA